MTAWISKGNVLGIAPKAKWHYAFGSQNSCLGGDVMRRVALVLAAAVVSGLLVVGVACKEE
jgi:hypothetical protein